MSGRGYVRSTLRTLAVLGLAGLLVQARAEDGDTPRRVLTGTIDSRVDLWSQRRRIPLPGVIVSSETIAVFPSADDEADAARAGHPRLFNVHRIELTGNPDAERGRELQRIALSGLISSYGDEASAVIARLGLEVPASRDEPAATALALDGELLIVEPLGDARPAATAAASGARAGGPTAAERDLALLQRYDLAGVISSEDRLVEPLEPDAQGLLGAEKIQRGLSGLADEVVSSLLNPELFAYVRSDGVDFDDGRDASSTIAVAGARFTGELRTRYLTLRGIYRIDAGEYLAGDLDGYFNHTFDTRYLLHLGRGNRLGLTVTGSDLDDQRATGSIDDFQATVSGPYSNRSRRYGLSWQRTARNPRFNYDLGVSRDTAEADFEQGQDFDRETWSYDGRVSYRLNRRVTLLLDGRFQDIDYSERADSTQTRVRVGAETSLSRRLSANGSIGYEWKDFDDDTDGDGATSFATELAWRPGRRSTFTLGGGREIVEVFERGDLALEPNAYALQDQVSFGWSYDWTADWSTHTRVGYRDLATRNTEAGTEDWQIQTTGSYRFSKRLTLSGSSAYSFARDEVRGDYDRWTFTLRLDRRGLARRRGRTGS